MRRDRVPLLGGALAVLLVVGGCAADQPDDEPARTPTVRADDLVPTPTPAPTTPTPTPEPWISVIATAVAPAVEVFAAPEDPAPAMTVTEAVSAIWLLRLRRTVSSA